MKFNSDELTNEIIELSLTAKTLTDQINELKNKKGAFFTRTGNRKLINAYRKTRKASVLLMEVSYTLEKKMETTDTDEGNNLEKERLTPSSLELEINEPS